jgi:mycothiol synthase
MITEEITMPISLDNAIDLQAVRSLLRLPINELERTDFEEYLALELVRRDTCLWRDPNGRVVAFSLVDHFNNLCFSWENGSHTAELEAQVVDWGLACMRRRNAESGESATLDASCGSDNKPRLDFLERHGFHKEEIRTLRYERDLRLAIPEYHLSADFSLRSAQGEADAAPLAALHRAAFGTDHMTVEYRLAMMRVPGYDPELDLYMAAPGGKPVAFCVCHVEEENEPIRRESGYTDPIGVDPDYQGQGLGKAVLLAGLKALKDRGIDCAKLGTSSENISMQRLAETAGFRITSEKLWFSKIVG